MGLTFRSRYDSMITMQQVLASFLCADAACVGVLLQGAWLEAEAGQALHKGSQKLALRRGEQSRGALWDCACVFVL
jgi:hypothetical protein